MSELKKVQQPVPRPSELQRILLRPRDVALMLGCSRSTAYALIGSGVIPSVRLHGDRLLRVPRRAIEELAESAFAARGRDESQ